MNSKERAERNEKIMSIYNEMHAEGYKVSRILEVIGEKVEKICWGTLCNIRKNYEKK